MAEQFQESQKLHNFEILGLIGQGKFGDVSKARHISDGVLVALKKVMVGETVAQLIRQLFDKHCFKDSKERQEALKEAYLLKSLDHPNVIKCYDAWLEQNELHIALELAEFGDLGTVIVGHKTSGTLMPEGTVWYSVFPHAADLHRNFLAQISGAVAHLKNIKPANCFLDRSGQLKLGDLGLGRSFASRTLEQAQSTVGTPFYMSPECLQGLEYSYPSDLWSIGCVLYELCALTSPFSARGTNLYTLGQAVLSGQYPPVSDAYSPEMHQTIASLLCLDPGQRPAVEILSQFACTAAAKHGNPVQLS